MSEFNEYDTFLCYRCNKAGEKTVFDASYFVCNKVYYYLLENKINSGKILYEEVNRTNYKTEIPNMMSVINKFIIFICPSFFDRIVDDFRKTGENYEKMKEIAQNNDNIPYLEINAALDNENCDFIPIFIDYPKEDGEKLSAAQKFNEQKEILKRAFGGQNRFDRICCTTNIPEINFQYDDNGEYIVRSELAKIEAYINNTNLYREKCENFKSKISTIENIVWALLQDGVMQKLNLDDNEFDWQAYNRYKNAFPNLYHISNGYINGVKCLKKEGFDFYGKGFNDVKAACGPFKGEEDENSPYIYWPVELTATNQRQQLLSEKKPISICAICFGAILLKNYLENDKEILAKIKNNSQSNDLTINQIDIPKNELEKIISGALNLLLTLRDYDKHSWMSVWDFTENDIEGTINQTTLSISTLLTCGFLSDNYALIDNTHVIERLHNRVEYIKESFEWLNGQKLSNYQESYWYTGRDLSPNVSLTVFCFDCYIKYIVQLNMILSMKESSLDDSFKTLIKEEIKSSKKTIAFVLIYLSKICNDCQLEHLNDAQKLSNITMATRSLIEYILQFDNIYEENKSKKLLETAKQAVRRTVSMVISVDDTKILNCVPKEKFSFIKYNADVNDEGEEYEHCGHLMCIDMLIKASCVLEICNIETTKAVLKSRIDKLIQLFEEENVIRGRIVIEKNNNKHEPIYAAYYYRIVIMDYYKYLF